MSDRPFDEPAWHSLGSEDVLERLETTQNGLSAEQMRERLVRYGYNRLPPPERTGPLKRALLQFHNVLIYVLVGAAVGTAFLRHWVDTAVITGVVLITAIDRTCMAFSGTLVAFGQGRGVPPMQFLFGTAAPGWGEWAIILASGVTLFELVELEKAILKRREVQAHQ